MENYWISRLLLIPGFIIGFALHEFAHALAADKLGDPTPRLQGRLTIEPWPHIDIIGFLSLILVGFGWAKPVQIDPRNFKNPKRDDIIVSLAGPLTNLVLAIIFALALLILDKSGILTTLSPKVSIYLGQILYAAVWINALLFVFNLLPIPPLDGSHIVANLLPYELAYKYMSLQVYSLVLFILLAITDAFKYIIITPTKLVVFLIEKLIGLS